MLDSHVRLTPDLVKQYLSEITFQLRPQQYQEEYPNWPGSVGVEIEMLPLMGKKFDIAPLLQGDERSLLSWLEPLAKELHWQKKVESFVDSQGVQQNVVTLLTLEKGDNLSFEPGGQLEISTLPYPCLAEAVTRVRSLRKQLKAVLGFHGAELFGIGFNPVLQTEQVGLQMKKKRYFAMDEYFKQIGPWGSQMMRQTCTVQVCLDFGPDEKTMAKRYWLSQMLAPFAAAIFANSPFKDRQLAGMLGWRTKIWRHIDPTRTGLIFPEKSFELALDKKSCLETYEKFLLESNVVFIKDLEYQVPQQLTFKNWMQHGFHGVFPKVSDLETSLSLLFPEVRPRGFFELRSVDNQHERWQFVPAAFWTTLMYQEKAFEKAWELLSPLREELPSFLDHAVDGLKNAQIRSCSQQLMRIANDHLEGLPACFRGENLPRDLSDFAERFTYKGKTPADELVEIYNDNNRQLDEKFWHNTNDRWM